MGLNTVFWSNLPTKIGILRAINYLTIKVGEWIRWIVCNQEFSSASIVSLSEMVHDKRNYGATENLTGKFVQKYSSGDVKCSVSGLSMLPY